MESSTRTLAGSLLMAAAAAAWLASPGSAQSDRHPAVLPHVMAGPPTTLPGDRVPSPGYVGEETCLTCHEGQTKGYHDSAHGRASNASAPIRGRGCESCHGPGQAHVEGSGDASKINGFKSRMAADAINAQCLECHTRGTSAMWEGSSHDALGVSCVSCHSIHSARSAEGRLREVRQIETCVRCHRSQVQKLRRSSHMPVDEGALECSSCHNPHGSAGDKLLEAGSTINDTCERCHADKRGPYLWEHAPVTERCTTCHDAHGSTNDRMLVAKEPFLCQRCHVTSQHPATVYDGYALANSTFANRMSGRSCAACHQNVHGSNAPSGKAFLR